MPASISSFNQFSISSGGMRPSRYAPNRGSTYSRRSRRYASSVVGDNRRHSDRNSSDHVANGISAPRGSIQAPRALSLSISSRKRCASALRAKV